MDKSRPLLIVAESGRALAASARRGGYIPFVADRFGDQDTLAVAEAHTLIDLSRPINGNKLISALEDLLAGRGCSGIVCGSGFEDDTRLLAFIAGRWNLLGNTADVVACIKEPLAFAALCAAARVPHPETSLSPPADRVNWFVKRAGGSGGWHIRRADGAAEVAKGCYFQRRIEGIPVSALMLCNGSGGVAVLGFTAQWAAPTPWHPFRYGGAVRPAELDEGVKASMVAAVTRICQETALVGLNSADFMVDGDTFHLLEINPRPSATFDLFEMEEKSLFAVHVEACAGVLPSRGPVYGSAMAGAIVYAERDFVVPAIDWPDWIADRSPAGSQICAEQPVCSVFARAANAQQARHLVEDRIAAVHKMLDARV
ncbi:MAG TPA: ATP-grasp domain-containing protein [Pseudolabrys sp.]|nr:ATP-grasp domain-containing protein [Pseudolabrys sp.]